MELDKEELIEGEEEEKEEIIVKDIIEEKLKELEINQPA